jgi:sporulation protein YqfD
MIRGYSPERFINLCSNRDILIWNLKRVDQGYEFYITIKGFRQLRPIVKKTKTRPLIKKRIGLPFIIQRYKKRKGFVLGILFFAVILYVLSLYIWDISITGEYTHTDEAMLKYLHSIHINTGIKKSKVNCQDIEEQIRKEYNDIGWVSAEIKGTRLLIKITETNMPAPVIKPTEPCHIIASKDGVIASIITRKGTPLVKEGDEVKKGDILVSGVIDIMGDNGEVMKKEAVVSDADIQLKTDYEYMDSFPLVYQDKEFTNQTFHIYGLTIFNKNFYLFNPLKKFKKFDKYDIIEDGNYLQLSKSFYLPIQWMEKDYLEYQEVTKKYTAKEAEEKASKRLNLYLEKIKKKGVLILQNNVKISIGSKTCVAKGNLIVEEPEMELRRVEDNEWRSTDTDEHNGDNH